MSSDDWSQRRLSDFVSRLDAGVSVNADDRPRRSGEVGVLKTSALSGGTFRPDQNKTVWVKERRRVAISVEGDSIIVSRMNTPDLVGESAYVSDDWPDLFLPDRLWLLRVTDRKAVCVRWLSYVLASPKAKAYLKLHATGTSGSMKNLSKARLLEFPVLSPPVSQQHRIAAILDTLDEAIRRSEDIIAKLKLIKQGLLHDLLTRGVDEDRRLRPSIRAGLDPSGRESACPAGWSLRTLGSVADYINGYPFKPEQWKDHGTPIIRIAQMTDPSSDADCYPGALPSQYRIEDGDLLFSWSATLMAVIWSRGPAYINQHIFKVVPRPGIDIGFLHHLLDFNIENLAARSHGTTMRHITQADLLLYRVSVPPFDEQRRIATVLDNADAQLATETSSIDSLRLLKSGLVDDLLTGRVRVCVPEEATA